MNQMVANTGSKLSQPASLPRRFKLGSGKTGPQSERVGVRHGRGRDSRCRLRQWPRHLGPQPRNHLGRHGGLSETPSLKPLRTGFINQMLSKASPPLVTLLQARALTLALTFPPKYKGSGSAPSSSFCSTCSHPLPRLRHQPRGVKGTQ